MLYPGMLNCSLFRENGLRRAPSAICSTKLASVTSLASAAGLRCRTPPRLPRKPQGMLATDSGVATEMPDGPSYADLLVPARGKMLRRMSAAGPKTSPA